MTNTNNALLARREANVPRGVASAHPVFLQRGANAEAWDVEGRRYIDFASGIAVLNSGHRHPDVMTAALAQAERFTHAAFQVTPYEPYVRLAEELNALAPCGQPAKTLLLTTGAEAVENAVKIARFFTGRSGVIAFAGGFHGRTSLTLGLTGKTNPYKAGFGPFPGDLYHVPFPHAASGVTLADTLEALDRIFAADIDPQQVAAIIIEPVQGEGGYIPAPPGLFEALREICDEHRILLIADEVQTGFARTGRMFAIEHYGVAPDLITFAKGVAGGFPLAGVIGCAEIMDSPPPGGLGGTFGGNPISCAAALATLDVIRRDDLLGRSTEIGAMFVEHLSRLRSSAAGGLIGDIRGLGAMVAFDVLDGTKARTVSAENARRLVADARDEGLLLLACGMHGNVIRLMPALTAPFDVIGEGLDILTRCISALPVRAIAA